MVQDAVPNMGSVAGGDFTFWLVPVNSPLSATVQTFDMHFFTLSGNGGDSVNFNMSCDPFRIVNDPINLTCDYFNWLQLPANAGIWTAGPNKGVIFNPGDYSGPAGDLVITATPEPSTLALLLMSFATLFLLSVGVRPNHR
jgi:hypothetical protein